MQTYCEIFFNDTMCYEINCVIWWDGAIIIIFVQLSFSHETALYIYSSDMIHNLTSYYLVFLIDPPQRSKCIFQEIVHGMVYHVFNLLSDV